MRREGSVGAGRTCSVDGCERTINAKGLCDTHYRRLKNRGTTDARTLSERFHAKYVVADDGCWVWQDSVRSRYGFLLVDGRKQMAHRVGYELLVGPIPEGMQLDHLCRNRTCVNPAHLEPVTQQENILRSENMAAKWARRTHCHKCGTKLRRRSEDRRYCPTCELERNRRFKKRKKAD